MSKMSKKKRTWLVWGLFDKNGELVDYDNCPCIYETRHRALDSVSMYDGEKIRRCKITVKEL